MEITHIYLLFDFCFVLELIPRNRFEHNLNDAHMSPSYERNKNKTKNYRRILIDGDREIAIAVVPSISLDCIDVRCHCLKLPAYELLGTYYFYGSI